MIEKKSLDYEKTVLVGIVNSNQNIETSNDYLDELEFLSYTAGGRVLKRFIQNLNQPNPKTFIGSGKLNEIFEYNKLNDISSVIFDDELTPTQQGNIEKFLKCKILD